MGRRSDFTARTRELNYLGLSTRGMSSGPAGEDVPAGLRVFRLRMVAGKMYRSPGRRLALHVFLAHRS